MHNYAHTRILICGRGDGPGNDNKLIRGYMALGNMSDLCTEIIWWKLLTQPSVNSDQKECEEPQLIMSFFFGGQSLVMASFVLEFNGTQLQKSKQLCGAPAAAELVCWTARSFVWRV